MNWAQIVTAVVAAYGAILSTLTFLRQVWAGRARVKVDLGFGMIVSQMGQESPDLLSVTAMNVGSKPVTLSSYSFLLPHGHQLHILEAYHGAPLPHTLGPGTSSAWSVPYDYLPRRLSQRGYRGRIKVVAAFRDQVGTWYRSKKFTVDAGG